MATSPDAQLSFDEVVERVLAADPESFYAKGSSPAHHNASPTPRQTAEESIGDPAPQAVFGRFAQFATRPAATPAPARKTQSFNGFARLVDQEDPVVLVVTGLVDRETTGQRERKHAEGVEFAVALDRSTVLSNVDKVAPVRLESTHAAGSRGRSPAEPADAVPELLSGRVLRREHDASRAGGACAGAGSRGARRRGVAAGESGDWTAAWTPAGQPCRDHTGDHRLGFTGGRKSTEQGEDAR